MKGRKRIRQAVQKYSWYENDPILVGSEYSHVNLHGIAPELFGNNKARYVELDGSGTFLNRREKFLYDKKKGNLIYWDNAELDSTGELVKENQYESLWDLHNSVKGE